MVNQLTSKNPPCSPFGVADVADWGLHRAIERLVELGGPPLVAAMLIDLGCRSLRRTEIDSLVSEYELLARPPAGEA